MILSTPLAAGVAFASGGDIALDSSEPASLAQRIAGRVAANPGGLVRSYRAGGVTQAESHAALWRKAGDVASALSAAGVQPGSKIVILAEDILDFLPAAWACIRGGFIPVALMSVVRNAIFERGTALDRLLSLLSDPAVLIDDHFAALTQRLPGPLAKTVIPLASVLPAPAWTDHSGLTGTAWLVATSGSTGQPKLAAISTEALHYRNFAHSHLPGLPLLNMLGTFPLDGIGGQHAAFLHHTNWTQIAANFLTAAPAAILDAIETCAVSTVSLTSSMMRDILAAEAGSRTRRLGSLTLVGLGSEPILAGLAQQFAKLLVRHGADPAILIAGYGATETGSLVAGSRTLLTADPAAAVCLGPPWLGVSMRIVDDRGALVSEGEIGLLEVLCPAKIFSGYLGDPEATAAAFTPDGWWRTGDRGALIKGELTLHGRARDVLILSGRKLSLTDIDAEIQQVLSTGGVGYSYYRPGTATQGESLGVVFDPAGGTDYAAAIQTAIVRRFGVQPQMTEVAAAAIPRTAGGKVRRGELAALALQAKTAIGPGHAAAGQDIAGRLGTIWATVLGIDRAARTDDDFFALGGDSLRAVTLDLQIEEAFGIRVPSAAFFEWPAFQHLLRLVQSRLDAPLGDPMPDGSLDWPLPPAMRRSLASLLDPWTGTRASASATIMGHNTGGDQTPIFWIFNWHVEAALLAEALGPRQPLYAMRSGYLLIGYSEDEVQALALRYVAEITQLCPAGPLFIGGNCQGGIIAIAVAGHLLRRKRHVPLLVLMDWSFELQPYPGRVLLMSGVDNVRLNPRALYAAPERAWARAFAQVDFVEISGGFGMAFQAEHAQLTVSTMRMHMQRALDAAPTLLPESGYRAAIVVENLPAELQAGERRTVRVTVRNASEIPWAATAESGLVLSSRWRQGDEDVFHRPQPSATLPRLGRDEAAVVSLQITVPDTPGAYVVSFDVLEEGNRWFGTAHDAGIGVDVSTPDKPRFWRRVVERLRSLQRRA